MTDTEGEIEYLDEDEDIVQKCVQSTQIHVPVIEPLVDSKQKFLVERAPVQMAKKKKKPQEEDSSDYDPVEDLRQSKKRKIHTSVKSQAPIRKPYEVKQTVTPVRLTAKPALKVVTKEEVKIHDYEDPLCLPVSFWGKDGHDSLQRSKWNSLCMQRLKGPQDGLKPRVGRTVSSTRIVVLRNVTSNLTRKLETTMWSKTVVQNKAGETNTEVCQSVLPKFREKTVLEFNMPGSVQKRRDIRSIHTTVLSKEDYKEGEVLVVYQPSDAVSSVYALVELEGSDAEESCKRHLRRTACVRACAPCYQVSWRPARAKHAKKEITCPICQQPFLSVYNLLSHVRTHRSAEVRRRRKELARSLSKIVEYHYKCRICQQSFLAIRDMRQHVKKHICKQKFHCEIGNHFTQ